MKRLGLLISTTIALFFAASIPAKSQTILLDDNFDLENNGTPAGNFFGLSNWNVFDGSIDLLGTGTGGSGADVLPGNGLYLDLDGSTGDAARLESKSSFSFEVGDIINLSFDLAGSQRTGNDTVIVSLGSLFNETFTFGGNDPFTTINRTINVNSLTDAFLTFDHAGGDFVGLLLDDVRLTVEQESVPESSTTLALLVLGGLGIQSLRRRKQNL